MKYEEMGVVKAIRSSTLPSYLEFQMRCCDIEINRLQNSSFNEKQRERIRKMFLRAKAEAEAKIKKGVKCTYCKKKIEGMYYDHDGNCCPDCYRKQKGGNNVSN